MKAMIVSIKPKWLKMILDGTKKFEFRNWKVPVGTVIYFYESLGKKMCGDYLNGHIMEGRGKVVAKCVVKEVNRILNGPDYNTLHLMKSTSLEDCKKSIKVPRKEYEVIGYTEGVKHALELDKVEEIEPRDITEFIGWNNIDKLIKDNFSKYEIKAWYTHTINEIAEGLIEYQDKQCNLTKAPQSRVWIYKGK